MALDDTPIVRVTIEEEQAILLAEGDTGLIEKTIVKANVFALCLGSNFDHLEGLQGDVVRFGKSHHVSYQYGCGRTEASYGERALDDTSDATLQLETLAECIFGSSGIVAPMTLTHLRRCIDVKINDTLEGARFEMDVRVFYDIKPEVDAFVDGETCDQTMLVVDMSTKRANAIG